MKKIEEPKVRVMKLEAMDVIATSTDATLGAVLSTSRGDDISGKMGR